jgi:hypothetical protein
VEEETILTESTVEMRTVTEVIDTAIALIETVAHVITKKEKDQLIESIELMTQEIDMNPVTMTTIMTNIDQKTDTKEENQEIKHTEVEITRIEKILAIEILLMVEEMLLMAITN